MTHRTLQAALSLLLSLSAAACGDDDVRHDAHDGGDRAGAPGGAGAGGRAGEDGSQSPIAGAGGGADGGAATDGRAATDGGSSQQPDAGDNDQDLDAGTADEDAGSTPALRAITLRFAPKMGDRDFACGQSYDGVGSTGATVEPLDFKLYVQDLTLITASGLEVEVLIDERSPWQSDRVALLDFADDTGACAGEGTPERNLQITGRVPPHDYVGVSFVNGVPEDLNHGNPPTLPAPLQTGNMQWSWLLGYRFVKLEVQQVAVLPPALPGVGYAHPGSTACSGTSAIGFACNRLNRNYVRLEGFDPDEDAIAIDAAAVFANTDLTQDSQCHGTGAACPAMFAQLGIDYATGAALPSQHVFSVE